MPQRPSTIRHAAAQLKNGRQPARPHHSRNQYPSFQFKIVILEQYAGTHECPCLITIGSGGRIMLHGKPKSGTSSSKCRKTPCSRLQSKLELIAETYEANRPAIEGEDALTDVLVHRRDEADIGHRQHRIKINNLEFREFPGSPIQGLELGHRGRLRHQLRNRGVPTKNPISDREGESEYRACLRNRRSRHHSGDVLR